MADGSAARDVRRRLLRLGTLGLAVLSAAFMVSACSSSKSTRASSTPTSAGTAAPVEVNPPGDIPDNQAFVAYHGAGFTVLIPEGWAQTKPNGTTVFSDKYNSITIAPRSVPSAPTVASVQSKDLPIVAASAKQFKPGKITAITRSAGPAVLMTYQALSTVNPVTGKVAKEAVERYAFWQGGIEVDITLAAPVGSDNVDPWRKVTDSVHWTGK